MTGSKERISQLPDILGVSKKNFFSTIGVASSGFRGTALNGEVSSDIIVKILTEYPRVNLEWLLQNKGEALKSPESPSMSIGNDNQGNLIIGKGSITPNTPHIQESIDTELIERLSAQLEEKDNQIRCLIDLLQKAQEALVTLSLGKSSL